MIECHGIDHQLMNCQRIDRQEQAQSKTIQPSPMADFSRLLKRRSLFKPQEFKPEESSMNR